MRYLIHVAAIACFILDIGHSFFGFPNRLTYTYKIWGADPMFFSYVFIVKYKRRRSREIEEGSVVGEGVAGKEK